MKRRIIISCALAGALLLASGSVLAQLGPPRALQSPQLSAQKAAPIDLTGYWVSVVSEDWRWRMLTPPHGDYASVPLSPTGRRIADQWTSAEDGSCKAYYAAGLMRMPTRVHITWATQDQLKLETDWGEQTRLFYFKSSELPPASGRTSQGRSFAVWQHPEIGNGDRGGRLRGPPLPGGKLYVVTSNLAPGWLRRNGVPYGLQAKLSEWYQVFDDPTGKHWFDVTTDVEDPEYLNAPFITSSDYRQEPDSSYWSPHPCKSDSSATG